MKATENTEDTEKIEGDALTHAVIGAAIEVHRVLGPGLLESIYEEALCHELMLRGIKFERQKAVDVRYKGIAIKGQRLDLIVEDALIVEIKSLATLPAVAMAQVLSYLRATGAEARLAHQLRRAIAQRRNSTNLSVNSVSSVAINTNAP